MGSSYGREYWAGGQERRCAHRRLVFRKATGFRKTSRQSRQNGGWDDSTRRARRARRGRRQARRMEDGGWRIEDGHDGSCRRPKEGRNPKGGPSKRNGNREPRQPRESQRKTTPTAGGSPWPCNSVLWRIWRRSRVELLDSAQLSSPRAMGATSPTSALLAQGFHCGVLRLPTGSAYRGASPKDAGFQPASEGGILAAITRATRQGCRFHWPARMRAATVPGRAARSATGPDPGRRSAGNRTRWRELGGQVQAQFPPSTKVRIRLQVAP